MEVRIAALTDHYHHVSICKCFNMIEQGIPFFSGLCIKLPKGLGYTLLLMK